MNKQQVVERYASLVSELGLEAKEVVLNAGGALTLFGIRSDTSDLDVDVPGEVFKSFKKATRQRSAPFEVVPLCPGIDLHVLSPERVLAKHTLYGVDVYTYTLMDLGKQKRALLKLIGRPEAKRAQDKTDLFFIETTLYSVG